MITSIAIAVIGGVAILIVIVESIKDHFAVKRGERPCGECFACDKRWLFDSDIQLRRYIEDYHVEICRFMDRELYGDFDDDHGGIGLTD
jgi:hypothetical protein